MPSRPGVVKTDRLTRSVDPTWGLSIRAGAMERSQQDGLCDA